MQSAAAHRRTAGGASFNPARAWAINPAGPAIAPEGLGAATRIWFVRSLYLSLAAGLLISIDWSVGASNLDTNATAAFAFHVVGVAVNLPAEAVIAVFKLSPASAEALRWIIHVVGAPYQTFAYAGAYMGSTAFHVVYAVVPAAGAAIRV